MDDTTKAFLKEIEKQRQLDTKRTALAEWLNYFHGDTLEDDDIDDIVNAAYLPPEILMHAIEDDLEQREKNNG